MIIMKLFEYIFLIVEVILSSFFLKYRELVKLGRDEP